ncbi:Ribonuclease P protein subunit p40 [Venturia nashicola]|uniref:Ribonuclease P protein subunit p40 n=1 Tax=Venturia nashicola TaxID=86259 RepID=A0A4Z1PA13_9PEZI|nr:Ribonuclease P protein subunit p40 [Venturia nashicola]
MRLPSKSGRPASKCLFTHCKLPDYVDGHRPPTKREPFAAINSHSPVHTLDLLLPEELYAIVKQKLEDQSKILRYARIYVSLLDIVSGDFFNQYIKAGNVLMRSEGRPGVDNIFSIQDGQLRLELDKATYERCGLVGKVIPDLGRKHVKSRYAIELDLRLPSMVSGKKGFERIIRAFTDVLDHSLAWLFVDLESDEIESGPITKQHPQIRVVQPIVSQLADVVVPFDIDSKERIADPIYEEELLEWIGLATMDSPRINCKDDTDRFYCRYDLPDAFNQENQADAIPQNLVHLRWHGFASAKFVRDIWLAVRATSANEWFAMSASTFEKESYTIFCPGDRDVLLWECRN